MKRVVLLLLALALLVSPTLAQETAVEEANLVNTCVETYDPEVDYFPNKVTITHATGFEIEYHNNYKVVSILTPYPGATETFKYVLVQCGTPAPEDVDDAYVIEVPVSSFIALSTTQLPYLDLLDRVDSLVALDSLLYANTPAVVERIEAGEIAEVGSMTSMNVELVLDLEPDIVMSNMYDPVNDSHPVLVEAGVNSIVNSEWLEPDLLARAEWLKLTATLFNEEAAAQDAFDTIVSQYEAVRDLAQAIPEDERVTALINTPYGDVWSIPGQGTWTGKLLQDAGINWVLMDAVPEGSADFSVEEVYEAGLDAPVWITNAFMVNTLDDLIAQDPRYADFAAIETGIAYNNNAQENANGGNDYWETGVTNPQLLLADLVAMFYPDVLPTHEIIFYQELG